MTKHDAVTYRPFRDVAWRRVLHCTVEVPLLARSLRLVPGQRILEVGCGLGIGIEALRAACRPTRTVGLDIDRDLVVAARARLGANGGDFPLCQADVRDIPFVDASFDMVIDFGTCYHIAHPERALKEIARILTPGGVFVYETWVLQFLSHPIRRSSGGLPWHVVPNLVPDRTAGLWSSRKKW